jgi:transposase
VLLPETIDEYVAEENPVRVIEALVAALELSSLGLARVEPKATGRPGYHPATMLKLYLYGYLNRMQSSRRLEQEARRNLELMWLVGRLAPDFKTIADFRAENAAAIRQRLPRVHRAVPALEPVYRGDGSDRRQQVQGGEPPRSQLHQSEDGDADGAD